MKDCQRMKRQVTVGENTAKNSYLEYKNNSKLNSKKANGLITT